MLKLEFPTPAHEQAHSELIQEWSAAETTPTSPVRLFAGDNFLDFLNIVTSDLTLSSPKVPGHLFYLMDDTSARILGAIRIRHHINHPDLIETGGHIGYGIRPDERGKGYATKMLSLAIEEVRKLGIERVLLTCDDDNIGSWKVIEANGGVFERFAEKNGVKCRRYWIDIN